MVSDQLVVFDNLSGKLILIHHADPAIEDAYQIAESVLDLLVHRLRNHTSTPPVSYTHLTLPTICSV